MNINDWAAIQTLFDKLNKQLDKTQKVGQKGARLCGSREQKTSFLFRLCRLPPGAAGPSQECLPRRPATRR